MRICILYAASYATDWYRFQGALRVTQKLIVHTSALVYVDSVHIHVLYIRIHVDSIRIHSLNYFYFSIDLCILLLAVQI